MERTDELKERIRQQPLNDRLEESRRRIGDMCSKGRCPKMTIPVQHDDDDFYINTTLADAQETIAALQKVIDDHHRLVREMDVRINGEHGAAKQASLCDIVSQVAALQARVRELEEWQRIVAGTQDRQDLIYRLSDQLTQRTAELEAARVDNRTYINERHENMKQIEHLQAELERVRGDMPSETVLSVTEWANTTFGQATIRTQIARAEKEFVELLKLQEVDHDNAQLAEEAADVCICLYRVIGTLDPEAINKKMAKNRARKWNVNADGTAQHVGE